MGRGEPLARPLIEGKTMFRTLRLGIGLMGLSWILASCGPTGNVIQQLRTGSTEERVQAARKLGQVGGEEAVEALVSALSDPFPEVQAAAAEALGNLCRQAQGDLWTQRREGTVQEVVKATTLRHGLGDVSPDSLVGMTLEFTSGPRKGERFTVSANNAAELTVAEAVDFTKNGQGLVGSTFQIGHPVSAALIAALTGSHWRDAALRAYEETIDTGAPSPDLHLTLARLYSERGQKAKALEHLDEAFSMAENADQYINVAREFGKLGEREKALQSLDQVREVSSESPNGYAYINAAREYITLGQPGKARELLAEAEKMAITQKHLYTSLASAYDLLGEKEKAAAARAKAGSPGGSEDFSFPGGTFQVQ